MTDKLLPMMPAHRLPTATSDKSTAKHRCLKQQYQVLLAAWLRVKKSQGMGVTHEARVAARRLRTLLKAWRTEIHPVSYAELRFDLRNLGRLLATAREADVRRRLIAGLLRDAPHELLQTVNLLLAHLDRTCAAEHETLRDHLHGDRWRMTMTRIQACIDSDQLLAIPRANADCDSELRTFNKEMNKLLRTCARKRFPAAKLHAMRIRGKNIRYVGEALSDLHGQDLSSPLKTLRQLQDLLGDLHDCMQIGEWCRANQLDPSLRSYLELQLDELQAQQLSRFDEFRNRVR